RHTSFSRDWSSDVCSSDLKSAEEAVRAADVICTATTSKRPVFEDEWVRPGTHVNGVGAYTPEMQEIPTGLVQRARIVVDQIEARSEERRVGGECGRPGCRA